MQVAGMFSFTTHDNVRGSSNPKSLDTDTDAHIGADTDTGAHTDTDAHTGADTDTDRDTDEILKARDLPKCRRAL